MDADDFAVGLVLFAILALGAVMVVAILVGSDNYNQDFARHCKAAGGQAIISDKNLCVRNGLIIDWEH